MRRLIQAQGAEVIHLGHNRSVEDVVRAALQEDADGIALSSYQGGHNEFFKYMVDMLKPSAAPAMSRVRRRWRHHHPGRNRRAARAGRGAHLPPERRQQARAGRHDRGPDQARRDAPQGQQRQARQPASIDDEISVGRWLSVRSKTICSGEAELASCAPNGRSPMPAPRPR